MPSSAPRPTLTDLRACILTDVDRLARRRAGEIDEAFIDAYVAAGWMQWHGGALRLTPAGLEVCTAVSNSLLPMDELEAD